jgi:hypothetical protein
MPAGILLYCFKEIKSSHTSLLRRPDHLVQLHLKPDRQRVGNDALG